MIASALQIRVIRALLGMNSQDFARKLDISVGTLTAWEKDRSSPQQERRKDIARLCRENGIAFLPSGMPVPARDTLIFKEDAGG